LLTRTPAFYTVHSWSFVGTGRLTSSFTIWLERALRFAGGTIIEVCRSNFEMARRCGVVNPSRHLTIWNGMPDTPYRAAFTALRTPVRLLMAARLIPQKGHSFLLEALAGIEQPWQLTLAGDGPYRAALEQLSLKLGIRNRVLFTGDTDQVGSLLASSDIFVLPSQYESLPLSIIEAMRAGLPVIATNVGGVSELVTDGVTGYLVPPSDPLPLRERLCQLISFPEDRRRMGHLGRLRYERDFRVEVMAGAVLSLYRENCRQAAGGQKLLLQTTGNSL
jgi:glycosyltransferase involved in cell wall biosynthesis